MSFSLLPSRRILKISGQDRQKFLQGLVTCDLRALLPPSCLYGLFLTPKGKIKSPFFLFKTEESFFMDLPEGRAESVLSFLVKMKLQNEVFFSFTPFNAFTAKSLGGRPERSLFFAPDPRLAKLGFRGIAETESQNEDLPSQNQIYKNDLAKNGILDDDLILENRKTAYPSFFNLDFLNAISWDKGCYTGQEIVARFYHRNLTKWRVFPLTLEDNASEQNKAAPLHPLHGAQVLTSEGEEAGSILYAGEGKLFLALLHKDYWKTESKFSSNGLLLRKNIPSFFPADF